MSLAAGARLGPYEILAPLGAGGMGEVYRARDTRLGREVAIKVLPAAYSADPDRLRRFGEEARAASALNHPNILTIHDVGAREGSPYVVYELLEGETLRELLAKGGLTARKAVEQAAQIALGLAAAHERGIVHRDLKPENVFVTRDGRIKILDFGLAKLAQPEAGGGTNAPTSAPGTEPGVVMGTVGYMSPEQVRGEAADHRSDIFSFGAMLYEMVTGQRAFRGDTAVEKMNAILKEEPAGISLSRSGLSPAVDRVVRRCLEKRPAQRFQSASDLAFALNDLSVSGVSESVAPAPAARTWRLGLWAAAGLAVVLVGVWLLRRGRGPVDSLAVLPFVNASGDPAMEYLSDGITESLINSLSQLPNLRVISRASSFHYKGKEPQPSTAAKELGVRAVVTGRVVQRGELLSIATELVDTRDNRQLWGEQYNRKTGDILALQEEIARQISEKLRLRLTGVEQARLGKSGTVNPEAYAAYLRGFYHARKVNIADLQKGMEYFRQALALDPNYAPAYAGMAYCEIMWLADWYGPAKEAFARGKEAAWKAIELDPSLAEAHTYLAMVRFLSDYDWEGAGQEFRRAIELNPADVAAHATYGVYLGARGRFESGEQEIKRALGLDPLSFETLNFLGVLYYFWRRNDDAIAQLRRALELNSSYFPSEMILGQAQEQKGQFREAAASFERARRLTQEAGEVPPEILADLVRNNALAGDRAEALKALEELKELMNRRYVSRHDLAIAYLSLGDKQQALDWLEKAYEDRNWWVPWLGVEPRFDPIRSEPRFQDLLRRIGLPFEATR